LHREPSADLPEAGTVQARHSVGLDVGEQAPDFTLPDHRGGKVTLSSHRGQASVLLHFFPFAFTNVCTQEWRSIRDIREELDLSGAVLLGISCDSPYALADFAERAGIQHDLLSDFWPHGRVSREYGLFLEDKGFALRGSYLIDIDGRIAWSAITGPAQDRTIADYVHALRTLQAGQ